MYEVICYDRPFYNQETGIVQKCEKRKIFKKESIRMILYIELQRFIFDYIEVNRIEG